MYERCKVLTSDEECSVLVLRHQKFLLGLDALDFAEVPSEKRFDRDERWADAFYIIPLYTGH